MHACTVTHMHGCVGAWFEPHIPMQLRATNGICCVKIATALFLFFSSRESRPLLFWWTHSCIRTCTRNRVVVGVAQNKIKTETATIAVSNKAFGDKIKECTKNGKYIVTSGSYPPTSASALA